MIFIEKLKGKSMVDIKRIQNSSNLYYEESSLTLRKFAITL